MIFFLKAFKSLTITYNREHLKSTTASRSSQGPRMAKPESLAMSTSARSRCCTILAADTSDSGQALAEVRLKCMLLYFKISHGRHTRIAAEIMDRKDGTCSKWKLDEQGFFCLFVVVIPKYIISQYKGTMLYFYFICGLKIAHVQLRFHFSFI